MKKRFMYSILVTALGLNLFLGAQFYFRSAAAAEKNDVYQNLQLFTEVLEHVRQDYVDGKNLSYQDLIYGALKGMIGMLDPHSEFMEPQKYEELRKDTEGQFGGIGILIGLRDKTLTIIQPMEDTPAMKAGLLPGDRIIRIGDDSTKNFTLEDAVKHLRGEPGSEVRLTILRPVSGEKKEVRLKRANIKVHKVKDINGKRQFPLGPDKIGYVKLLQFDEQTSDDLESALDRLESQGMKALILDLRGNPGGLLDQAVAVCAKFLPRGTPIVSTEGRNPSDDVKYTAKGRHMHAYVPMVVLVNGSSASASEIVAGCLQDEKRAIIVGQQTFGKGSVQKILPLDDGAALRLTTAKYYTPSHRVIHERGITPDIRVAMTEEEEQALYIRHTPGGLANLDELLSAFDPQRRAKFKKLVETVTDRQLDRARDLLKGILLFSHLNHHDAKLVER